MKTERGPRAACGGVIKRGTGCFKLIGSAVTSGPQERLGVLTTQSRKPSQAGTGIGGQRGTSGQSGSREPFLRLSACGANAAPQKGAPGDRPRGASLGGAGASATREPRGALCLARGCRATPSVGRAPPEPQWLGRTCAQPLPGAACCPSGRWDSPRGALGLGTRWGQPSGGTRFGDKVAASSFSDLASDSRTQMRELALTGGSWSWLWGDHLGLPCWRPLLHPLPTRHLHLDTKHGHSRSV